MAEHDVPAHKKPDTPLLVAGAVALTVSSSVLFGGSQHLWVAWSLVGAAVLVGVLLLVVSMARRDR